MKAWSLYFHRETLCEVGVIRLAGEHLLMRV